MKRLTALRNHLVYCLGGALLAFGFGTAQAQDGNDLGNGNKPGHETPRVCDPSMPNACGENAYCKKPLGKCDSQDVRGVCVNLPSTCPAVEAPVCGCDGMTYRNRCEAAKTGASIRHFGPCRVVCSREGDTCPDGQYCALPAGSCDDGAAQGLCLPAPNGCPDRFAPVCGCDGETYRNRCLAAAAGVSVDHYGRCRDLCDRSNGETCDDGEFCMFPAGTCDSQDVVGKCREIPTACPEIYEPVCGCDGMTYGNRCEAAMAGVSIDYPGECGCTRRNPNCGDGMFCLFPPQTCRSNDVRGQCVPVPDACPDVWEPVCGCDGVTYGNRCVAHMAGVSIAHHGECQRVCGGIQGLPCNDGEFCKLPAGTCDSADLQGVCVEVPNECRPLEIPVCGCDGQTYRNPCEALRAGVQLDHRGRCEN